MKINSTIYLFFTKKYTQRNITELLKALCLEDFSLGPITKSRFFEDFKYFEAQLSFSLENQNLTFNMRIEDYENDNGTNTLELDQLNEETFNYVHFTDNFFSIFKKMKNLEGIALVTEDETAPSEDFYRAFKRGEFDDYLQTF